MKKLFGILIFFCVRTTAYSQNIYTYAGTGVAGFSGDGGGAMSAQINFPLGIAYEPGGSIYFCDANNNRIRKISSSGIIMTIAGGGTSTAEGVQATSAILGQLSSIILDASGNIYFSEVLPDRIRKINTSGIINTIAGGVSTGFSGDGGPGTSALLNNPGGMALDAAGNLYFADSGNHRIRKVNTSGIINTIAGTITSGFSGDGGLAINAEINLPSDVKLINDKFTAYPEGGHWSGRFVSDSIKFSTSIGRASNVCGYKGKKRI